MKIDFSRGAWSTDDMTYAYTYRFPGTPQFRQCEDHVENAPSDDLTYGCPWENVSVLTRRGYSAPVRIETRCAFRDLAAPLITVAKAMYDDGGEMKYGDYFEVVLYQNGVNIWQMHMDEDKTVTWKKMLGAQFPVAEDEIHTLAVTVTQDGMTVDADAHRIFWRCENLYESFHVGIDACEGLCRFYSFAVTPL